MEILQARILEWVAMSFSRESSQPMGQIQISCIAGGFFTVWATRDAQDYWSETTKETPFYFYIDVYLSCLKSSL